MALLPVQQQRRMVGNRNSGRRFGQSYGRRTDAQIARDQRREQQLVEERRSRDFFEPRPGPRQAPPSPPPAGDAIAEDGEPPDPPPDPDASRIDRDHPNPTADNPLPGVDMSRVPEMFRLLMGKVLHELRARMKGRQHP